MLKDPILEKLFHFFEDSELDELNIHGSQNLILELRNEREVRESLFVTDEEGIHWLQDFCFEQNLRLDFRSPSQGGELKNSDFRWHAVIPPLSIYGPLFSLRRHRFSRLTLEDFTLSSEIKNKIDLLFKQRKNVIFCGPTSSGKTSILVKLLFLYFKSLRVFILETLLEIPRLSATWVKLLAKKPELNGLGEISIAQLIEEALRLRPEVFVLGEIRGSEAKDFLNLIDCGHEGVYTTFHANNKEQALRRLAFLSNKSAKDLECLDLNFIFLGKDRKITYVDQNLF